MPTRLILRRDPIPPHCPYPDCLFHLDSSGWRFKRAGFFLRQARPHRIQRYRCSHCRRSFSSQSFSPTYWLRRPDLLEPVFRAEVACSAHRQVARQLGTSHATLQRLVDRLGRHCLLLHETLRNKAQAHLAQEPLVLDGLGSFAGGQYWPLELTHLLGTRSTYSHDFVVTERRRAGSMTPRQKTRRAAYERKLGRPDPKALTRDVLELLASNLPPSQIPITLRSDEKAEYRTALKRLNHPDLAHQTTHSKAPRTAKNPLFPINAHHMFVRHSGANHKRETVAFSKRIQAVIHRHAIFQVWKNLVKAASERRVPETPAQRLGITDRPWTVGRVLRRRLFPTRIPIPERILASYRGDFVSRFLPNERGHQLRRAY